MSEREEAAYVLLEQARIVCERLRQRADGPRRRLLDSLHRELGKAGFSASSNLDSRRRRTALERAHRRCREAGQRGTRPGYRLGALTQQAQAAVERALIAPGLSDHMHDAHLHVVTAQEILPLAIAGDVSGLPGAHREPFTTA